MTSFYVVFVNVLFLFDLLNYLITVTLSIQDIETIIYIKKGNFMKKLFALLLFFLIITYAQERKSIHQQHKNLYGIKYDNLENKLQSSEDKIIPLNKDASQTLNKSVFGYLPYWEYLNGNYQYIKYDLISHIGVFDFSVSSTGIIGNPSGWPWTPVINEAHSAGTKVIMVVANFDADEIRSLITNEVNKQTFFINVKAKLETYNLDGVNIDFEAMYSADQGERINLFMSDLTDYLKTNMSDEIEVSFAAPAVNWGSNWDLLGLAQSCDYLFIMGYDFFGSWSTISGPTSPLIGGSVNISNTVNVQYSSVVSTYPEKLILGMAYFGGQFETQTNAVNSTVIDYVGNRFYRDTFLQSQVYGRLWSTKYEVPYYVWEADNWMQVWFDDFESLGKKYDLALVNNLKGVGMWALGYDGQRQELWNLINLKFGSGALPPPSKPLSFNLSGLGDKTISFNFEVSDGAAGYKIFISKDGINFYDSVDVATNNPFITGLSNDSVYYFKVKSYNSTGFSEFTEVLGAVPSSTNQKILIVNGFDRASGDNNSYDYIRQYGQPILDEGYRFVSTSNEAVFKDYVDLKNYEIVIWMLGDESTSDETFNQFEQERVISYLDNGGKLFVSGSEIGWDLDEKGGAADRSFYNAYLKADYYDDAPNGSSGTYYFTEPITGEIFDGISNISFDNGTHGTFDVDWPDAIKPINGSTGVLKYVNVNTTAGFAGVVYKGSFPAGTKEGALVHLAVPFETMYDLSDRKEVMQKILFYFDGTVAVDEFENDLLPNKFAVYQNYPNPFNPETIIEYQIPSSGNVTLQIFNSLGELISQSQIYRNNAGNYKFNWNSKSQYSSGTYLYRINFVNENGNSNSITNKMILLK